jgi:hypothetical protein
MLTDGVDNFLQDLADKHENNLYLLGQRTAVVDTKTANEIKVMLVKVADMLDISGLEDEAGEVDNLINAI